MVLRLLFLLLCSSTLLVAQQRVQGYQLYQPVGSELDYHPCATPSFNNTWMRTYQQNPAAHVTPESANTLYLPLTLHLVGNDNGTGYPDLKNVLNAFCRVNQEYASTNIQFYIEFPIRYVNNSLLNNHDSVYLGGALMPQYNVANTTNCYFVTNPAGACGYNVLYGGLTVSKNCLSANTFSHELGHALGLQHTFFGWEGGQGHNGPSQQTFTIPAPDRVLYDYTMFKDTFWGPDTIIVDTALVEKVARTGTSSNCYQAADGFCDTPADYLAFRWACNSSNESTIQQLDPDSVAFVSNGINIMSYSTCRSIFSNEQGNGMRAFAQANRSSHIGNTPITDTIDPQTINLLSPANNSVLTGTTGHTFRWNRVPGATHYLLHICRTPCSTTRQVIEEVIVTDTFYVSNATYIPRSPFLPYRWQLMAFNQSYTCAPSTSYLSFNTQLATDVTVLPEGALTWAVAPNPSTIGQPIELQVTASLSTDVSIQLYGITGQLLQQQQWAVGIGKHVLSLPTTTLSAGIYLLRLSYGHEHHTYKIVVQP